MLSNDINQRDVKEADMRLIDDFSLADPQKRQAEHRKWFEDLSRELDERESRDGNHDFIIEDDR